jgi:hypothetical protein
MEKPHRPQLSGTAVAAAALPPFAFCAVVSSAAPRLTTWVAMGSVATLLTAFLYVRRRPGGDTPSPTRTFAVSLLGVLLMFAAYTMYMIHQLSSPI